LKNGVKFKGKRLKALKIVPLFLISASAFLSCATSSFAKIDEAAVKGNYVQSVEILEEKKKEIYQNKDVILYYLDKGMLSHYAERYDDSSALLQDGERAIEAAFTKSVSQEIASYLVNDTVREYDGEDYEDIYINAFNALNYYHNKDLEGALVEIRRMSNKLRFLASKYGVMMSKLQEKALEESGPIPPGEDSVAVTFTDSALARYLGMLFYRGIGKDDDARIDRDYLKVAFANAPSVYPHPTPVSVDEELDIPRNKARLNVVGFSGLSPVKEASVIRILLPNTRYAKISLPVMVFRPSTVSRIEVIMNNGERFDLELLEDMEAIARETFKEKKNFIYLKSVVRALVKGAASSTLSAIGDEAGGNTGLLFGLASIGTQVFAEVSEQADLRLSRYFPGKAYVGGITLDPGIYSFTVRFYAANGRLVASHQRKDVTVQRNSLNLAEVVCLN
jgi:hypothetical protein